MLISPPPGARDAELRALTWRVLARRVLRDPGCAHPAPAVYRVALDPHPGDTR